MTNELIKFCCTRDKIANMPGEISNLDVLLNGTKICFPDNTTPLEQASFIVYHFFNSSAPYKESDCYKQVESCDEKISTENMIYLTFWSILLLLIVISNLIVIIAMLKHTSKNNTTMFLSSLALSDMLVGLFIIPIKMRFTLHNQRFCLNEVYCRFYIAADNMFFAASNTNLFIICIDTYIILTYPYKYMRLMSPKRCKLLILFIWCNGLLWGIMSNIKMDDITKPAVHIQGFQCSYNNNYIHSVLVAVVVFFIPAVVMAFLYLKIFSVSRYHAREISEAVYYKNVFIDKKESDVSVSSVSTENNNTMITDAENPNKKEKRNSLSDSSDRRSSKTIQIIYYKKLVLKASKTVAIVYGTFVLCWLPVMCLSLVLAFCPECVNGKEIAWFYIMFVEIIPISKSTLNPFIYALTNKQYRHAFKDVFVSLMSAMEFLKRKFSIKSK